jgi:hypothetical protein
MFRRNPRTPQPALLSDLNLLPAHQRERLKQSWAGTLRQAQGAKCLSASPSAPFDRLRACTAT